MFAGIYDCSEHRDTNNTETYKTNFIRDIQVLRVASRELRYYFNVFFPCDELKHHKSLSKTNVYYMVVSYTLYYVYIYIYVYDTIVYCAEEMAPEAFRLFASRAT